MLENWPDAVGEALGGVRAGLGNTVFHAIDLRHGMGALSVDSVAFGEHGPIPAKYTADGAGLSPPLTWSGVPAAATEVVVIVEDADSPTPQPLVLAIVHRLPRGEGGHGALDEGVLGAQGDAEPPMPMGRNSLLQSRWLPPDPPPGHGLHRYVFQVYALEAGTPLPDHPGRDALRSALMERGLASGCLIGTYERPSGAIADPLSPMAASPVSPLAASE